MFDMSLLDIVIRILIAAVLGGLIGVEREIREHTAGFRTHILVSVGAAAFTVSSFFGTYGTSIDPNRISANVVTGIGFLGAGAIIRYGMSVRGLTTAASLWTVAAVGLLTGQGSYAAAIVTTGVVVTSLYFLRLLEDRVLHRHLGTPVGVHVQFHSAGYMPLTKLFCHLQHSHVIVTEMAETPGAGDRDSIYLVVKLPRGLTPSQLVALAAEAPEVKTVRLD
jgi:putative Mg2+ transporter-C (MgtC) family protein